MDTDTKIIYHSTTSLGFDDSANITLNKIFGNTLILVLIH